MSTVTRLVTVVDLEDRIVSPDVRDAPTIDGSAPEGFEPAAIPFSRGEPVCDPKELSCTALHLAVLDDDRRVTLLDDRGWSEHGPPDLWQQTTLEEIAQLARTVVGPDAAYGNHSQADMAADHWAALADNLRQRGVLVDGQELSRLPHEVEFSQRLSERLTNA